MTNVIPFKRPPDNIDLPVPSRHRTTIYAFVWYIAKTLNMLEEDVEEKLSKALGINGITGLQAKDFDPVLRFLISMMPDSTVVRH